ncbi:lamin tail domain-containing protein [Sanyastnella coralliicola]|uniref:lamin tail domain-containing protein n=1 Tax=Sanyastnella coralliicola TaxID=3069118 RepID=UPI0027B9EE5B|nr:lamin tail domain-containing protein [Longitalea sp. SCSIO 12813]
MRLFLLLTGVFLAIAGNGQVVINEVLAGNQNDIQDDFFEYDDWIEIYNPGSIINLAGYYLSDDPDSLDKWLIPSTNPGLTTILPGGYQIFWIDNDEEQGEDHASFKLSTDGETIFIVEPDGETIVDQVSYPQQQPDISYGRECDGCDEWIFFDVTTPDATNQYIQPATQILFVNEVLAENSSDIVDQAGEHEPWIEIFNPNPIQVNLANYKIQLDGEAVFTIPNNDPVRTTVDEDGFLVLYADGELGDGADHISSAIQNTSGTVTLIGPDDSTVDTYEFIETGVDMSYGRSSDGGPSSSFFTIPTPRVTNQLIIIQPEELYINEVMAENDTDTLDTAGENEDWIELYNPNDFPVDVAGYYLSDNPFNPTKWQIPTDHPDSSVIAAGGYLIFFADEQGGEGWNHTNFRLSNNGEHVILRSPDGFSIADQISFGPQQADTSYGRFTDGAPTWVLFTETTPEYSNNGATVEVDEVQMEYMIYPNPVTAGQPVVLPEFSDVKVFSMSGRQVDQLQNVREINTEDFTPGVYLLIINDRYRSKLLVR